MAERGTWTDPVSWGRFVQEVGINGATILALLGMLSFLAFRAVPAIVDLSIAIERSTDAAAVRQTQIIELEKALEHNDQVLVENQGKIIDHEGTMIEQHGEMQELLKRSDTEIDDLMADKKARDAVEKLHRR